MKNMTQENRPESVEQLIFDLGDKDGMVRQRARTSLTKIGEPATDDLIRAFNEKTNPTHFEAAKTLSQIGSAKAIAGFIKALEDEEFSVRWVAAEGLIATGKSCIRPLLKALEVHSGSTWLREGTHHVLHDLVSRNLIDKQTKNILLPVLEAYQIFGPVVSIRVAAREALNQLRSG